jgi:rhamnose utilization protein RhaD (predicted bifunctional aldolase and dehydrogenase)/NAD(P)-dependent dehydrogenase (short-subunit alcohol dehydrogenase family)
MKSLWNDDEASQYPDELGLRVYTSRLLGRESSLVLHGGGNTSVKIREKNLLGEDESLLYVKGSGWDLETIEAGGFAPVRMDHLLKLARLTQLSDPQMVNELKTHMTRASAPAPSVETILHAVLPYKYVDHTHADAIVAVTNTDNGEQRIRDIYGDSVVIIPYIMPGFDLARLVAEEFPKQVNDRTLGMVLLNHGIFSFAETAKASYERMIDLVTRAEDYLNAQSAWELPLPDATPREAPQRENRATLRQALSGAAGFPMVLRSYDDPRSLDFARRDDIADISQQGPATPDHVIRTKRLPQLGQDVNAYVQAYEAYFREYASMARDKKSMLDPAPRVIIDPQLGVCCAGRSARDAAIVGDIYQHTIDVILRAEALGGYKALPARDLFDMEYWDLEQAKLQKAGNPPPFSGEIVLVTGAASGIGKACVESFLNRGAAVIALDINPAISEFDSHPACVGLQCDVTDAAAVTDALEHGVKRFGGLDMLVLNAGIFPPGRPIAQLADDEWRRVFSINLDANERLLRECHPLLKRAPNGGRVVVIGSKNVPAPGPGAAAYSASKAALNQLARVAALEWGPDNIRINSLHPNQVFDTAIWTSEVLQARADYYGLSVEEYKRNNVLKTEVTSHDVAELAAAMCGPLFAKTTASQVPVDGGNERVI